MLAKVKVYVYFPQPHTDIFLTLRQISIDGGYNFD